MSPSDFTVIKNKIETSSILTEQEKKEWLFLLPRMSAEQMKELDRILSIKMPSASGGGSHPPARSDSEARRAGEAGKSDVGSQITEVRVRPLQSDVRPPTSDFPQSAHQRDSSPPPADQNDNVSRNLDQLKSLTVEELRKAPSVFDFLEKLTLRIETLLNNHQATAAQAIAAFEQSPLYKAYLEAGLKLLSGAEDPPLNHNEFEALADFRGNLRKILK